jgi:group I intron endonuclease
MSHYNGNPNVKNDGVQHQWTEQEVVEYAKCMQDPSHFAKTYVKIISLDHGLVNFNLYPYQEKMFEHFNTNRFSVVLACRQSGKSISSVVYLLWYAIFHPEKTIAILANKGATAREMLQRVTLALENLPFFLQPGCRALNKGSIEFSNNSRIIASATSGSSIRGMSVNLLFLDEFAFVERASEFYTSTYPVVSSGKDTKVIITSTANGIGNTYHKIWEGAVQGTNEYKPFTVNWWDVPGRDEEWKKQTISNTSQLQFDQEFGNCLSKESKVVIEHSNKYYEIGLENLYNVIKNNGSNGYSLDEELSLYGESLDRIFITYKITNNIDGCFYIGKTSLDIWDKGYLGSGCRITRAVKKYGPENFTREILSYHKTEKDAYLSEETLINEVLKEDKCYNIAGGGLGVGSGENHPNYGKKWSTEQNDKRKVTLIGQRRTKKQIKHYKKSWTNERKSMQAARMKGNNNTKGRITPENEKQKRRENCPHKKSLIIDDVFYHSMKEVAKIYNLSTTAVRNRAKSDNFPNWRFYENTNS